MLNLFYEEPEPDRWLPFDRFPRRWIRRIVRGAPIVGGQQRVFLNLCAGLDRIGVAYRVNDYRHLTRDPKLLACVVGKPFVLDRLHGNNPILFGSAVFSHPVDDPDLLRRLPIRAVLVPGPWCREMFAEFYGEVVHAWPTGIDTDRWQPASASQKKLDFVVYDKIRWERERLVPELVAPLLHTLDRRGLNYRVLRYGGHRLDDFREALASARAMLFICEHETQGFAYQEALSAGVPVLAWDRGGAWRDPSYWPDRVTFSPVTSVPYWDERCGVKFTDLGDFGDQLANFLDQLAAGRFHPRDFILEHLTLEQCARDYLRFVELAQG
ncbi:MAG TPA: glycosyltransferase [Pirellulales bacterium]|nr:glycosyltransferase [Pirellulales bacterium]